PGLIEQGAGAVFDGAALARGTRHGLGLDGGLDVGGAGAQAGAVTDEVEEEALVTAVTGPMIHEVVPTGAFGAGRGAGRGRVEDVEAPRIEPCRGPGDLGASRLPGRHHFFPVPAPAPTLDLSPGSRSRPLRLGGAGPHPLLLRDAGAQPS